MYNHPTRMVTDRFCILLKFNIVYKVLLSTNTSTDKYIYKLNRLLTVFKIDFLLSMNERDKIVMWTTVNNYLQDTATGYMNLNQKKHKSMIGFKREKKNVILKPVKKILICNKCNNERWKYKCIVMCKCKV